MSSNQSERRLHTMQADEVFAANHPNANIYKYILRDYHVGRIPATALRSAAVILSRPQAWATKEEFGDMGHTNTVEGLVPAVQRLRYYVETNLGISVWTIRSSLNRPLENEYLHNKRAWFSTVYMLGNTGTPPPSFDCPVPAVSSDEKDVRDLYKQLTQRVTPIFRTPKRNDKSYLSRLLTGPEMIIADYLATHQNRAALRSLSNHFAQDVGFYRDIMYIRREIHSISHKIQAINPHYQIVFDYHDNMYLLVNTHTGQPA